MSIRAYILLFLLGLIPPVVIAQFQPTPGYLDSDYYFAGGIQLATGKGFTEPYLWNYLDGSTALPHPSHSYWMPMASMVAALGMILTGQTTFASGRILFILIAATIPPLTSGLAFTFSRNRELAFTSGLLAIFSVYHAPFVGVTDNFGLFMLFGGLYFVVATQLIENRARKKNWFLLGALSGLLSLSRTDGLLWLALSILFVIWRRDRPEPSFGGPGIRLALKKTALMNFLSILVGFLLVMAPWYLRNLNLYGTLMAPGGSRALWLGNYDQTFTYPPSQLTLDSFLSLGWSKIIDDRAWALGINLQSAFAAHGGIILFPFIVAGIVAFRRDDRVRLAGIGWLVLFTVMTVVFPFAGARGAFFHAGAAMQPMWWSLAPIGLESILGALRKRKWGNEQTRIIFRSALLLIALILTVFVVYLRLFSLGWGEGEESYSSVEQFLAGKGIQPDDIVIVRNAPGYYLETERSAITIPYGGEKVILDVARQFHARYLVLEPEAAIEPVQSLFRQPDAHPDFFYLGDVGDTRVFRIDLE